MTWPLIGKESFSAASLSIKIIKWDMWTYQFQDVNRKLTKYQHPKPTRTQHSPYLAAPIEYGVKVQQPTRSLVIMWPTFFKQECRNRLKFSRILGYVPNLTIGKGGSSVQTTTQKIQDEHNCLRNIFDQITKIHNDGGIKTNVMGPQVTL